MKGLLLKDFYMTLKYCKAHLFVAVFFGVLAYFDKNNLFFVFFPCVLSGTLPVTLLAYDEQSRWQSYSDILPYTRAEIVSGKYLMGLGAQILMLLIIGTTHAMSKIIDGTFLLKEHMCLMAVMLAMSLIASTIYLACMFKFSVEKGRIAHFVTIGIITFGCRMASDVLYDGLQITIQLNTAALLAVLVGAGAYAFSWYLSTIFYKRREL